jgi:hypothetical protein
VHIDIETAKTALNISALVVALAGAALGAVPLWSARREARDDQQEIQDGWAAVGGVGNPGATAWVETSSQKYRARRRVRHARCGFSAAFLAALAALCSAAASLL